jgi:hypothetical protein
MRRATQGINDTEEAWEVTRSGTGFKNGEQCCLFHEQLASH